jgi:hypothetical protein
MSGTKKWKFSLLGIGSIDAKIMGFEKTRLN